MKDNPERKRMAEVVAAFVVFAMQSTERHGDAFIDVAEVQPIVDEYCRIANRKGCVDCIVRDMIDHATTRVARLLLENPPSCERRTAAC